MKISQKALACNLSPMRKFHPFAVAATNNGKKIYHLNIGQPDIATPPAYFEAVRNFELPVLEYAPSPGLPVLIKAVQDYYDKLGIHYEESDILITTGGSEALQMLMLSILDDGSEVIIPEPFLPQLQHLHQECRRHHSPPDHLPRRRLSLCFPRKARGSYQRKHPRNHVHQPRQPHRRCSDS